MFSSAEMLVQLSVVGILPYELRTTKERLLHNALKTASTNFIVNINACTETFSTLIFVQFRKKYGTQETI